jgi:hypothetical protein
MVDAATAGVLVFDQAWLPRNAGTVGGGEPDWLADDGRPAAMGRQVMLARLLCWLLLVLFLVPLIIVAGDFWRDSLCQWKVSDKLFCHDQVLNWRIRWSGR